MGEVIGLGRFAAARWLARLFGGTTHAGQRDLYTVFGYHSAPQFRDFLFKYVRQDVAARIIEAPVKATWAEPPIIEADEAFMTAWASLLSQVKLWHQVMRLDRLAGLGSHAIMVVGIDDGADLRIPVRKQRFDATRPRKVLYMQPYMECSIKIEAYDNNSNSPRFGQPELYEVKPINEDMARNAQFTDTVRATGRDPFYVHHSRVLHVADNTLENPTFGVSRLMSVYNLLDDLLKVVGGAAEMYWLAANRGLQLDVDKEMDLGPEDAAALEDEVKEYEHNLRRIIRTRGVKINPLGSDTPDPWNLVDVIMTLIASSKGIPKRVLLGSEAGQLASTQDRANWAERVGERHADYAEPVILLPLIQMLVGMGVLPQPQQLWITWPEAFKLSPLERGQTSAQMARSAANLQKVLREHVGGVEVTEETEEEEDMDDEGITANAFPGQPGQPTQPRLPGIPAPPPKPKRKKKVIRKFWEGGKPLFNPEEARTIVGFGKHMPVFDTIQDEEESSKGSSKDPPTPQE